MRAAMIHEILFISTLVSGLFPTARSSVIHGAGKEGRLGIYGGHTVSIEAVPYMAALVDEQNLGFCGGVIINERFILSAAHCTEHATDSSFVVRLGSDHWYLGIRLQVEKVLCHENYHKPDPYSNDICLFKLKKHIPIGSTINLIELADEGLELNEGDLADVSGWGRTETADWVQYKLRQVTVPVIAEDQCGKYHKYFNATIMLCAGSEGHSSCMGDSGGPLTYDGKLIGLESNGPSRFGKPLCGTFRGAVYTKVASYLPWIKSTIKDNL